MKNEGNIKDYLLNSFGWNVKYDSSSSLKGNLPYALLGAVDYAVISYTDFSGEAKRLKVELEIFMHNSIQKREKQIKYLKSMEKTILTTNPLFWK